MSESTLCADVRIAGETQHYEFTKSGKLDIGRKRASPRKTEESEALHENKFIKKIQENNFNWENTDAARWMRASFVGRKVTKEVLRAIAELFAFLIETRITREYYRRNQTLILWLEENLKGIADVLSRCQVTFTWDKIKTSIQQPLISSQTTANNSSSYLNPQPFVFNQTTQSMNSSTIITPPFSSSPEISTPPFISVQTSTYSNDSAMITPPSVSDQEDQYTNSSTLFSTSTVSGQETTSNGDSSFNTQPFFSDQTIVFDDQQAQDSLSQPQPLDDDMTTDFFGTFDNDLNPPGEIDYEF